MEDFTGLTDEELEMLKQNNLDRFIHEQKKLNKKLIKEIDILNKRISLVTRSGILQALSLIILTIWMIFK